MKCEKFAERLRQALDEKNVTAEKIRLQCGISKATMSEYLSGQYVAKSERLEKLAQALECDPKWLEGYDVPKNSEPQRTCSLEVFSHLKPDGTGDTAGERSAPPEFCDGRHFWLIISTDTGEELLLCRRQNILLSGQTGVCFNLHGELMLLRCEQRRDVTCLAEPGGKRRIFINEETEELRVAARVIQSVRDW